MLLVIAVISTNNNTRTIEIIAKKNIPNKTNLLFLTIGMFDIEKATMNKPIQFVNSQAAPVRLL